MLHFGLREAGILVLGTSETITGGEDLFESIDKEHRIFRRIGPIRHASLEFPIPQTPIVLRSGHDTDGDNSDNGDVKVQVSTRGSIAQLATRTLLEQYTPAAVVVDRSGQIVYLHGNTSLFLTLPSGEPTRELLALANETVRGGLRTAMQRSMTESEWVTHRDGTVGEGPDRKRIEITAAPMTRGPASNLFIVSFQLHPDPPLPAQEDGQRVQPDEELARVRDELQSTIESCKAPMKR